jgi:hypothetical protein
MFLQVFMDIMYMLMDADTDTDTDMDTDAGHDMDIGIGKKCILSWNSGCHDIVKTSFCVILTAKHLIMQNFLVIKPFFEQTIGFCVCT